MLDQMKIQITQQLPNYIVNELKFADIASVALYCVNRDSVKNIDRSFGLQVPDKVTYIDKSLGEDFKAVQQKRNRRFKFLTRLRLED